MNTKYHTLKILLEEEYRLLKEVAKIMPRKEKKKGTLYDKSKARVQAVLKEVSQVLEDLACQR